ncbi:MAG TPA: hypothetical protein VGW57_06690 [Chthoniobacterales bacterium]|nr:hypothetical protein [Chthoniobacterales bacterium]
MSEHCLISFKSRLTLQEIERAISQLFHKAETAKSVTFDLTQTTFIGHFPATLLYTWCVSLRHDQKNVDLLLPPFDLLTAQCHKALVQCGLLAALKDEGVQLDYALMAPIGSGIPLTVLPDASSLWTFIESISPKVFNIAASGSGDSNVVFDALDVVLFELGENAFLHTGGSRPHFQLTVSESSTSTYTAGVMSIFPAGVRYLEICLGDFGPGIDRRLESHLPGDYHPLYVPRRSTRAQRILSYAFEFSATSDREGRRTRLAQLVTLDNLDPDDVASGLFCVSEVAKARGGQLLVRTPRAMLSLDFSVDRLKPKIKGHAGLGVRQLGQLVGSHFLIRLPIDLHEAPIHRRPVERKSRVSYTSQVSVLSVFRDVTDTDNPGDVLHKASSEVDRHFSHHRQSAGITVVMPAPLAFPSRALAAFLGVLRAIPHGQRTVLWLEPRAKTTAKPPNGEGTGRRRRVQMSGGQPVLIGDLLSNDFYLPFGANLIDRSGLIAIPGETNRFSLEQGVFATIQQKYVLAVREILRGVFQGDDVRRAPGPFLIEGKYYRDIFYEIPRALRDPTNVEYAAEWLFRQIPGISSGTGPDVIVGTTHVLETVLQRLAALIGAATGIVPAIVCRPADSEALWLVKSLIGYHGRTAVVLTDILCRGRDLEKMLSRMSGMSVDVVLALIDARVDGGGEPILIKTPEPVSMAVSAILVEPARSFDEPPAAAVPGSDEERIYVIDRQTRSPALYVRHAKPQTSLVQLFTTKLRKSKALICGHVEFEFKHYLNCLHFPRLFNALRREIEGWIRHQIGVVELELPLTEKKEWFVAIHDPDGALEWLKPVLELLPQRPKVRFITRAELEAPPPPTARRHGHYVCIIPAIASGEVARRTVELISRYSPQSILLLSIVARMDAEQLGFMFHIQKYADARLRFGVCFDFSLPVYTATERLCPACLRMTDLERLASRLADSGCKLSSLLRTAEDKIRTSAVIRLETLQGDEPSLLLSDGDVTRSRLLSDYNKARLEPLYAEQLSTTLLAEQDQVDEFLELVGEHRYTRAFEPAEIARRAFKAYDALGARVRTIVTAERPPFGLAHVLGGCVHLSKEAFIEHAADLVIRFGESLGDVEEICLELVGLGILPANIAGAIEALHAGSHVEAELIVTEAVEFLRYLDRSDEVKDDKQVRDLSYLFAKLSRSSFFANSLTELINQTTRPLMNLDLLLRTAKQLVHHWRDEIVVQLSSVRTGRVWHTLERDRGDGPLRIEPLEAYVSQVARLSKMNARNVRDPLAFRAKIGGLAKLIQVLSNDIASRIQQCFVNVLHCKAVGLPSVIPDVHGKPISTRREIDRQVDLAFCDLEDLNIVASELITNWQVHAGSAERREAWFRLFQEPYHVVLEFGDSFGGTFNEASFGGLLVTKEFCRKYCATLRVSPADEAGQKSIALVLRRFAQPSWTQHNPNGQETLF